MKNILTIKDDHDKLKVFDFIRSLPGDKVWRVEVDEAKNIRSLAQNALYFMWVGILSKDSAYTKKEMHKVLAWMFLEPMIIEVEGKVIEVIRSTADLKVKEFTEYLDQVDRFAAEQGIVLPHPEDLYFEAMGIK